MFFFKQKTAYEIHERLVGSEMCIRDSPEPVIEIAVEPKTKADQEKMGEALGLSLIHI